MDWGMIKKKMNKGEGEDRISELPDDLIHHILWFCDAQIAVETSLLSKRWKFIWTTLPFLNFKRPDDYVINCPQLVNLEINVPGTTIGHPGQIIVSSRKIRNFCSVSFFPIKFKVSKLENVNIKFGISEFPVTEMLRGLGSARIFILTLDSRTIEALSAVSDFLDYSHLPFHNIKYVMVPPGYESSMSTYLKRYLLGRSPKATGITPLSQNNKISRTATTSVTAQNAVLQEPLGAPTKVFAGSKNTHKTVCIDTVDMGVQEEQVVQNSAVNADRARKISAPIEGNNNNRVSSSGGTSDFRLWWGHEVNSEFVYLLDIIMNKYPETFEHFTTINKKFCTMKLNMLCTSVNVFTKICMNQVDAEMIAEHRAVFTALKNLGFNVSWLVNGLNFIEQLRFSQPLLPELDAIDGQINNAKTKLQDLQILIKDLHTLRAEKMQEIQKAFGTMGANLLVGCIGDDLLSGP